MRPRCVPSRIYLIVLFLLPFTALCARRPLHPHRFPEWAGHPDLGRVPGTNRMQIALALPLRNREALDRLIADLYRPDSPRRGQFLSPAEFAEAFGPSAADYEAVARFAAAHGLAVRARHANRLLLRVEGSVADIESALHTELHRFGHPSGTRSYVAPSSEPSLDLPFALLRVSGLDDFRRPEPHLRRADADLPAGPRPRAGSAPDGSFLGLDFRKAYAPDIPGTGRGQSVGLVELDGYYASDIAAYRALAGLPSVTLQNVLIDGFSGTPSSALPGSANEEVALDIEMAISMAPGLDRVLVYEASPHSTLAQLNDLLNRMATDNLARQLSCSWGFDIDATSQQIFLQYAAQGQSFFLASGDGGAFAGPVEEPSDNPSLTVVGGTRLVTDGAGAWQSEDAWGGSGGGVSMVYSLPWWQEGLDWGANQGSADRRNLPDVAMVADAVWVNADRGAGFPLAGTSIAAPLWAGFCALVNQEAAARGRPPVGFLNPALYSVGRGDLRDAAFHDITEGDNRNADGSASFPAVPGYDLCTGWGSPRGMALVDALLGHARDSLRVDSPLGLLATGRAGGPFRPVSRAYTLTNLGPESLAWTVSGDTEWLALSKRSGVLAAAGLDTVVASLSPAATNLLLGEYRTTLVFSNALTGAAQGREVVLQAGNGGFEMGSFTNWNFSGQAANNFADSIDSSAFGGDVIPGLNDSAFTHSGLYGVFLGQNTTLGTLSQTLRTAPGASYVLSFWLTCPLEGNPNEFRVNWAGKTVLDLVNTPPFDWTRKVLVVNATSASTLLQFGFRDDDYAFGLDDVQVTPVTAPQLRLVDASADGTTLGWRGVEGLGYVLEARTDLQGADWTAVGGVIVAGEGETQVLDPEAPSGNRFYRVRVL